MQVGNQQGYADIDNQRQLESNYKFSLDELSKDTAEQEKALEPPLAEPPSSPFFPADTDSEGDVKEEPNNEEELEEFAENGHDKSEL